MTVSPFCVNQFLSLIAEELTTRGRPMSSVPIKMRDFYKRNMFEQPLSIAAGSARGDTSTAVPRQRPSLASTTISTCILIGITIPMPIHTVPNFNMVHF